MTSSQLASVLFRLSLISVLTISARALTVSLDPSFGTGGKAVISFSSTGAGEEASPRFAVSRGFGKTLLFGNYANETTRGFVWMGLSNSGRLDESFAPGGAHFEVADPEAPESLLEIKELPDGRLLRLGVYGPSNTPVLKLFSANGIRDASFDPNLFLDAAHQTFARTLAVNPSGKITLLMMDRTTSTDYMVRFNADGSRDSNFGVMGIREINLKRIGGAAREAHVLPDGRIILGGYTNRPVQGGPASDPNWYTAWVAVLDENGYFDRRFGRQGIARLLPRQFTLVLDVVVDPQGRIILAGPGQNESGEGRVTLARFTPRGRLDTSFGQGGLMYVKVNPISGSWESLNSFALTPSGEIVAAGTTNDTPSAISKFLIARFSTSGQLVDHVITDFFFNRPAQAFLITCDHDGKILAAGFTRNLSGQGNAFALARYILN